MIYYGYDAYLRADWIGPTGILGLFLVSLLINRLLMSPVVKATVDLERNEGDFRFGHASIRSHAESLAFCGHQASLFEQKQQDLRLDQLCQAQFHVYKAQFLLEMATNGNSYLSSIASFLIIAVPIFSGAYDDYSQPQLAKMISETSFVCMYFAYQLSNLASMSIQVSQILGVTFRIHEMFQEMLFRSLQSENMDSTSSGQTKLLIKNLSVQTPDESQCCLVNNLSLNLQENSNVLITGPSSSGKTSLMRVIAR